MNPTTPSDVQTVGAVTAEQTKRNRVMVLSFFWGGGLGAWLTYLIMKDRAS